MPESLCAADSMVERTTTFACADEADLVERAKQDPQAFGELYESHYSAILNYFVRRTLNLTLAEELTSETFFKALRSLRQFRNRVPFRAWLYRIASNEIRMYWRKAKSRAKRDALLPDAIEDIRVSGMKPVPEGEEELRERLHRHAQLLAALERLRPKYREALVLRYFEGLKYEEIALVLNKRIGTVKSLVHRGLAVLKKNIERAHATF